MDQECFWPNNCNNHGDVYCILLLENCTANKDLDQDTFLRARWIPENLITIFLPPNVKRHYQPMDMGIISCFNVGYRVRLLEYLLQIFDERGKSYEALEARRKNDPRRYNGLCVGGKPTMLGLMGLSEKIWNNDAKYAYKKTIRNFRLKAGILPPEMMSVLRNRSENN